MINSKIDICLYYERKNHETYKISTLICQLSFQMFPFKFSRQTVDQF